MYVGRFMVGNGRNAVSRLPWQSIRYSHYTSMGASHRFGQTRRPFNRPKVYSFFKTRKKTVKERKRKKERKKKKKRKEKTRRKVIRVQLSFVAADSLHHHPSNLTPTISQIFARPIILVLRHLCMDKHQSIEYAGRTRCCGSSGFCVCDPIFWQG